MISRDIGIVVVAALLFFGGVREAWMMQDEVGRVRLEAKHSRAVAARLTALRGKAEAWLATASANTDTGATTPAQWIERARREGLTISRVSARGSNWNVSVEGDAFAIARVIDAQTVAVTMRPGGLPGRVRADLTLSGESRRPASLSTADLEAWLATASQSPEIATSSDSGWNLVFRSDEISPLATAPSATALLATDPRSRGPMIFNGANHGILALPLSSSATDQTLNSSIPYDYLGRIEGGARGICGVFKFRENGLIVSVKQGETLAGWKLVRVAADEAVLAAIDEPTHTVRLFRRAKSASS